LSTSERVELTVGIAALVLFLLSALSGATAGERKRVSNESAERTRGNGRRLRKEQVQDRSRLELTSVPIVQTVSLILATVLLVSVLLEDRSSLRFWVSVTLFVSICLLIPRVLLRPIATSKSGVCAQVSTLAGAVGAFERRTSRRLERIVNRPEESPVATTDERTAVHYGEGTDGELPASDETSSDADEVQSEVLLELEHLTVREIMVPRVDVVAIDVDEPFQTVLDTIIGAGHSRIPVFHGSIDSVVGILYAKDLLPYASANETRPIIGDLIRPASIVPESKQVDDLFRQMRRERVHIAVVVDEYGGMAGVVTIEDIIEELLGEIRDEYDAEEQIITLRGEAELVADGRLPVSEAEEALGVTLLQDEDDFETLGGYVHARLGRLPVEGDAFDSNRVHVEVQAVDRHRVKKVRLSLVDDLNVTGGSGRRADVVLEAIES
jgi:putative hemolysin